MSLKTSSSMWCADLASSSLYKNKAQLGIGLPAASMLASSEMETAKYEAPEEDASKCSGSLMTRICTQERPKTSDFLSITHPFLHLNT